MNAEAFGPLDNSFTGVSTDTRQLKPGQLFFCVVGKSDGHIHAEGALRAGAAGVVLDKKHSALRQALPPSACVLVIPDTLIGLGDLALAWRERFSIPVIAIGGSNGKTTTKNLVQAILKRSFRTVITEGNFNNLIGVPWTVFRLGEEHQAAVLELGMNDFGELKRLTEISRPTAGLLTNIGLEHLEKLKDLEGVERAEGELFAGLSPAATALVNVADPSIARMATPAKKFFYGKPDTPIWGKILRSELQGDHPLKLEVTVAGETARIEMRLPGAHNLSNVLASLAIAHHLGISLNDARLALEEFVPSSSRMELVELHGGIRVIDDSYNANPSSTIASLKTLAQIRSEGKTLAILGEMLELGEYSVKGHREVGQAAAEEKIDYLMAIGPHAPALLEGALDSGMPASALQAFAETGEAIQGLKKLPVGVKWILVKGSRGARLEKIVQHLKEHF